MSGPNPALRQALLAGADELGLALTEFQLDRLLTYLAEFDKWNRAYNLSAIRDIRAMVGRHLLDSLSVLPFVREREPTRLIDVGTGGGLPGLPLAIMLPQCQFTLLDSNGKKTRFLFHIKTLLGLDNVRIENTRAESHKPESGYPLVISRAFASLSDMTRYCDHFLALEGVFMAMKGVYPAQELEELSGHYQLVGAHKLKLPDTAAERHLVLLERAHS